MSEALMSWGPMVSGSAGLVGRGRSGGKVALSELRRQSTKGRRVRPLSAVWAATVRVWWLGAVAALKPR
jgi:hypothetical protein